MTSEPDSEQREQLIKFWDGLEKPVYCVVQVNNAFRNPTETGGSRWVAYPRPQVVFQWHSGLTGELLYAESVVGR